MLRPYRWRLAAAAVALLIAAGGVLAIGQGLRLVIDHGFADGDPAMLDRALLATLAMILILALASATRYYLITWIGERLAADLRGQLFDRLLRLEPAFFERTGAGEVQSRLTADTTVLQNLFGSALSIALRNALTLVGALVLLFVTSPRLATLVVVGIPLILIPIFGFGRRVRSLSRDSQDRVADVGGYAGESLHAISTVQAFGHEAEDRRRYAARVEAAFATAIRRTWQRAWLTGVALLCVFGAVGAVLWQGGHDVLAGRMTPGELSAFVFYAVLAAGSVAAMAEVAGEILRAMGATDRLFELIDAEPRIRAPTHPQPLPQPVRGEVRFDAVTFAYPARAEQPALRGVTLRARPGERVALVGPSGAGKSTLLQLLLRFYDPDAGSVRLDGVDLRGVDPAELRRCLGLVAQEPVLFTGTAAENIRYGRPEASDTEVRAAARDANALGFLEQLPQGLETELGPGGVQLSGGQRQRVAIARAILRDPAVLLLDEATSALDAESEQAVQQALECLMVGRTTLVIAHRLATVVAADRIVVLDQGRVEAQGTHRELQAHSPLYRRFCALQLGALEIETPGNGSPVS
ncbi:lipid A ABC exporter family, fused ATPase and inner membrane subunits [Halorhodospira halophila SL1]|uniref:Lipid A ABC exporter family, fused ATPase and inner membrane subunits n=2 Tax=Halorhodospira halophila TaxID=1053 RepID=A1WWR7_HALHL|nr:lipid A ABC exporter family, fused ATPase and inner membrane subunits [Halorhodospira halophila SL1]MBK1729457.1 ABC transporter [Halorhodospira halophila]